MHPDLAHRRNDGREAGRHRCRHLLGSFSLVQPLGDRVDLGNHTFDAAVPVALLVRARAEARVEPQNVDRLWRTLGICVAGESGAADVLSGFHYMDCRGSDALTDGMAETG